MTPPDLSALSDQQLSELVAVEVAGWARSVVTSKLTGHPFMDKPPPYATSADAILPLLEASPWRWGSDMPVTGPKRYRVTIYNFDMGHPRTEGEDPNWSRAACIGLLKAHQSRPA